MPLKGSHLRHVSNGSSSGESTIQSQLQDAVKGRLADSGGLTTVFEKECTLGFHDDQFSKLEALVNPEVFPSWRLTAGSHIHIRVTEDESGLRSSKKKKHDRRGSEKRRESRQLRAKSAPEYVFVAQEAKAEVLSRYPNLQISIHRRIAVALGFRRDCKIVASLVNEDDHAASHIEIAFRDAYLTRADMWRLVISELAGKSMYKGQKLLFMNTIKAQVKSIYRHGMKKQSAFFGKETKPIFRSESARYVLFIQMSKEMWDFDTDGTGDVMFHKVIEGFLPELFKRWKRDGARHLVSIILFTRMEYERPLATSLEPQTSDLNDPSISYATDNLPYKDFYRVLVSDMSSGSWSEILDQLKKDFKTFLRDVSIRKTVPTDRLFGGYEGMKPSAAKPTDTIAGRPTSASKGNILEAINVASSQFSSDYIDRDLVRTGLSIIVVTPGTGVFEVDYNLLSFTTDVLIESGVGIDLVCLSRMPLHSVPLFKYKRPKPIDQAPTSEAHKSHASTSTHLGSSFESIRSYLRHSQLTEPALGDNMTKLIDSSGIGEADPWHYGVPHWVDVSFWSPSGHREKVSNSAEAKFDLLSQKPFIPRVRMYEVQMMGIMENEMSNISIPYMQKPKIESGLPIRRDLNLLNSRESTASLSSSLAKDSGLNSQRTSPSYLAHSSSLSPSQQTDLKAFGSMIQWMEDYDNAVFRHPLHNTPAAKARREAAKASVRAGSQLRSRSSMSFVPSNTPTPTKSNQDTNHVESTISRLDTKVKSRKSSVASSSTPALYLTKQKPGKLSRQISFGFKGFGTAAPKATPVTEVSSENAHFDSFTNRTKRPNSPKRAISTFSKPSNDKQLDNISEKSHQPDTKSQGHSSKPIAIKSPSRDTSIPRTPLVKEGGDLEKMMMLQEKLPVDHEELESLPVSRGLSPSRAMSPWLTVLSPWNPSAGNQNRRLGRWQHVFPKPLHASHMKWKSLCSPASVPLTTEGFPTQEQLSTEYDNEEYTVRATEEIDASNGNSTNWLMREMISARFSHGFQIVLSDRLAEWYDLPPVDSFSIFDDKHTTKVGAKIFMLRGSNIHLLTSKDTSSVHVSLYGRRPASDRASVSQGLSFLYKPAVRTTLSNEYVSREITISTSKELYNWERLDGFISGHEAQRSDSYPDLLNFWRTRYVLIPIEQSSNSKRRVASVNEDNDEEIRLEGIRKLTQLWQKNKYISPREKRPQSLRKKEDANPLDLIYQTRYPSAIVAAEMNEALLLDSESTLGKPARLLPEKDLLERSNFNLKALASTIQGERGVRMMDRRWHWRLHYNCFIGMELTTWLLNNFRDVETREEAVELGDDLMKEGLFVHVEKRHNFRDGNFFYQIASDYRMPRADQVRNSWFGRSVPSTPMTDASKNMPRQIRSRASTDDSSSSDEGSFSQTKKHKLSVSLSKRLVYDVDRRRRSYRPELITLHYDRISSADDCYHLRIDWMNVTPKLIEDAIESWANLAERNGLHLVEVPIHEASKINDFHPFRGPYIIKLAKSPPDTQPNSYFDATSLSSTKSTSTHVYQKAILRKFNFVLDLEAAKDFPPSVDVEYSWGKPNYRYPQYISREGVLLAQITDEGHFLLLANRLFNNRSAAAREANRAHNIVDVPGAHHHSPHRVIGGAGHLLSPKDSPVLSPVIKATADVGLGVEKRNDIITPERLKNDLEVFCADAAELERFYEQVLREGKGATPGPVTPAMEGVAVATPPSEANRGLEVPPNFSLK